MTDFNRVAIHGRIAKNCESTKSDSGLKIVKFLLVSNKTKRLQDGNFADESSFFPLAVFGQYADLVEPRLNKGQGVLVEGRLCQHRWEKDGVNHSELVIRVDHLYFDPVYKKPETNGVTEPVPVENKYKVEQVISENPVVEEFAIPSEFDFPPMDEDLESIAIF